MAAFAAAPPVAASAPATSPADPVRADTDQALARFETTLAAVDATAAKAIDQQLQAALNRGELERSKQLKAAQEKFATAKVIDTSASPVLEQVKKDWQRGRGAAVATAATAVAAYDHGVRAYTRARHVDAATALRAEQKAFAARSTAAATVTTMPGMVLHLSFEPDTIVQKLGQPLAGDLSGANNFCRLRGVKLNPNGRVGTAAVFEKGMDAEIDCGDNRNFNFDRTLSVATFVWIDRATSGPIFSKDN